MLVSRLLAYFSEHAFCHWLVGRALGICFTGYGLHGTSHPQHYPPGVLPPSLTERLHRSLVAQRVDVRGACGDVLRRDCCDRDSERRDPGLRLWRGVPRAQGSFVGTNLWSVPLLLSESLRCGVTCAARGGAREADVAGRAAHPMYL